MWATPDVTEHDLMHVKHAGVSPRATRDTTDPNLGRNSIATLPTTYPLEHGLCAHSMLLAQARRLRWLIQPRSP